MASGKFVAYYRVSTARQGHSGLGLEAQRQSVQDYLNGGDWTLVQEFTEVESGKNADRVELAKAFRACRVYGAKLVIAKLDRLSRDAHFLTGLERAGVDFVCADMPDANRMTVTMMAAVAEHEAQKISERTRDALRAAKNRGQVLGGFRGRAPTPEDRLAARAALVGSADEFAKLVRSEIDRLYPEKLASLRQIAAALNDAHVSTRRGGRWSATQVKAVLDRTNRQCITPRQ